jgi:hypothetical protein
MERTSCKETVGNSYLSRTHFARRIVRWRIPIGGGIDRLRIIAANSYKDSLALNQCPVGGD